MSEPSRNEQFAVEFNPRFEALISWTNPNWPEKIQPLVLEDFGASRREIVLLVGAWLFSGQPAHTGPDPEHCF